jgi:hypothetical protein
MGIDEGGGQGSAARPVVRINVRVAAHPGVHEHEAVGMLDEVAQARLDSRATGRRLLGRAHKRAEVDASDPRTPHPERITGPPGRL